MVTSGIITYLEVDNTRESKDEDQNLPKEIEPYYEEEKRWLLTCFYGDPKTVKRQESWNLLKSFKPHYETGWCIVGDFNEILTNDEKWGGNERPEGQMKKFREVMHEGNLCDLGWYGDKNSKYFHACANEKRRKNYIGSVYDEGNRKREGYKEVEETFQGYFQNLFLSSEPSCTDIEECLRGLGKRVSSEMNDYLLKPFSRMEVEKALKQMTPLKAPGPDGFGPCFYQNHWKIVSEEVCSTALSFLNGKPMDPALNYTHIALIPKCKEPKKASEYRPIALCNVMYKIVSKTISNRFKKTLSAIISPTQSAFLPGRLIIDNIMVAYELLHSMKSRKKGRVGSMAIKLDMSKAYDRVEWVLLEAVMTKLGFRERWVKLIMSCVRTVSFSVLINGQPGLKFWPGRGLRQGDPLSPYLFILCAEGLSNLLNGYEIQKLTKGVQVARGSISINHLLFADDCILFGRAKLADWFNLQEVLKKYERASGQFLNKEKNSIFFSSNTKEENKKMIKEASNSLVCGNYDKYLGLPTMIGRSSFKTFRILKEMIWKKITSWKNNFLSQAGKEIMIKAVLQAIPTYTMSVFQLPKKLCQEINMLYSRFWWGKQQEGKSVVFKDKYYRHSSFLEANLGSKPSSIWRSFWNARALVKEGIRWRVGDGSKINIWGSKWLPCPSSYTIQSPVSILQEDAKVEELINKQNEEWDEAKIKAIFKHEEAIQILKIPLSKGFAHDKVIWSPSKKGVFTVGSAYFLQRERIRRRVGECSREVQKDESWRSIWNLTVPNATKFFLWKAGNNLLPTKDNLFKRKVVDENSCPLCSREVETNMHVLWECYAANDIWTEDGSRVQKWNRTETDFLKLWESLMQKLNIDELELMALLTLSWSLRKPNPFKTIINKSKVRQGSYQHGKNQFVKVNWDASLDTKGRRMRVGIIIRDNEGEGMVAVCDQIRNVENPVVAECYGLRLAVELCSELYIHDATFEGDAKNVIMVVQKDEEEMSDFGSLIEDIKFYFNRNADWHLQFTFRESNTVAHCLAKKALSLLEKTV
ncbi:uncharacterized protein LOC122310106 [Carya illinoinensis]|uniref:uncharacterized protein LOC122310106 n=1 Tax=Carya illinoinensis TaxID=32201 RepID=UPI001C720750|nr:uncharacterized protein LOC122310106 [Carya illinoinensis]